MKYLMIVFLVCVAPMVGAQYWLGFENDGPVPIDRFEIHWGLDIDVYEQDIPPWGTAIYTDLVSGRGYQLVVWDSDGWMYTTPLDVPGPGTSGGLTIKLSDFLVVRPPIDTGGNEEESNEANCSTGHRTGWLFMALIVVIGFALCFRGTEGLWQRIKFTARNMPWWAWVADALIVIGLVYWILS